MIIHNQNFDIMQIADSGQCFRMNYIENKDKKVKYGLVAYGRYLELTQLDPDTVEFSCSEEEFYQIWEEYFDLKYDYGKIVNGLINGEDPFLKEAALYGKGIRILKQEPFEAAISFIISQNKNIPAIKNCIEGICRRYGEQKENKECGRIDYVTFPTAEVLGQAVKEDLRALKTGYRDEYILKAAQAVKTGELDLENLKQCSFEEAVKTLKGIHGIGEKVANCISLYGLHHIEGFPVDVWIQKVLKEIYNNQFDKDKYKGYSGIVQQYMFYYMRHLKSAS
ncbi:MAG: DNA glycosylase [Herbinix sp.]|nr:DNA glycosylase [Herbinix sp.]